MSIGTAGAIIVGTAEAIKLTNTLLSAYLQAAALAKMTETQIDIEFQKAKAEYFALPDPSTITPPA